MSNMDSVVSIEGMNKTYNGIKAVDSLNLDIKRGEVFGFLGPNGAGKTTTIKAMIGLLKPDKGSITIDGEVVTTESGITKSRVGYLPEVIELWGNLTGRETLDFMCDLKGVSKDEVDEKLVRFGLQQAADRKVGEYSKGMRQRLALAQSILGTPDLLILDEPSSGLDPSGVALVKQVVREHVSSGRTVFFSSHILPIVEDVADRVGIIVHGRLKALDSVENLRDTLEIPTNIQFVLSSDHSNIVDVLKSDPRVRSFSGDKNILQVSCGKKDKKYIIDLVEDTGVEIRDFSIREGTLEDIFLRYSKGDSI